MLFAKKQKNINRKDGFVALLALLLANIFLLIGVSVFNISMKEFNLSSAGRNSLFAFYAADGGMECALYWDIRNDAFATTTTSDISCNNQVIIGVGGASGVSTFDFNFAPNPYTDISYPCATVTVTKNPDDTTLIKSYGKNTCDSNSPKRVERAWKVTY